MLKAIVFDFDGVIVDSEPLHYRAFVELTRALGVDFDYDEYLQKYIGYDDRELFALLTNDTLDSPKVADLCRRKARVFERVLESGIDPIPGARELIDEARNAMPIAIASGATRADIDLMLARAGIANVFVEITTADDVTRSKPDPQTYTLCVQRLAKACCGVTLAPGDCLAIEDTAAGIASARGAGLQALGVSTTGQARQLREANHTVDSMTEVTLEQLHCWFD
ncbi:MAG: HAD family hydrolase [Phycisphaerae bacterium]|nr:HAD family hydrolase [Phycisphaerae bacterium]